jgi:hypothetical protein
MTTEASELNKQAWIRFLLGILALTGVVWGASANVERIDSRSRENRLGIEAMRADHMVLRDSVHSLELKDMETSMRQQEILSILSDVKKGQNEFRILMIEKLNTFEAVN